MKNKFLAITTSLLAMTAGGYAAINSSNDHNGTPPPQFVEGELVVTYKDVAAAEAVDLPSDLVKDSDGELLNPSAVKVDEAAPIELIQLGRGVDEKKAIEGIEALPEVEAAELNYIRKADAVSNDPLNLGNYQWWTYGDANPYGKYGTQAEEAWNSGVTGSNTVYVAVIDTGFKLNHPDLSENFWVNPFDPADGVDNDNNGFVDDTQGWDFVHENNTVYDQSIANGGECDSNSCNSHGTSVAGVIGAKGGNGVGGAGMAWDVKIIPVKGCEVWCELSDTVAALDYVTNLKKLHGLNIVAVNNSYGGYGSEVLAEKNAILRAGKEEILVVASAGNDGFNTDSIPHYPSGTTCNVTTVASGSYDCVISVGGIEVDGDAVFNYGASSVDLAAPAVMVLAPRNSDLPYSVCAVQCNTYYPIYSYQSGTSFSAPAVVGAIVLYKSENPSWSAKQLRNAVLNDAAEATSLAGKNVTNGRLDLSTLAGLPKPDDCPCPPDAGPINPPVYVPGPAPPTTDVTPPTVPTNLEVSSLTSTSAILTWDESSDVDSYVAAYVVTQLSPGSSIVQTSSTSIAISGLSPSTEYTYSVAAKDGADNVSAEEAITFTTEEVDPPLPNPTDLHWRKPFNSDKLRLRVKVTAGNDTVSKLFTDVSEITLRSWEAGAPAFSFSKFYPYSSGEPDIEVIVDNYGSNGWLAQTVVVKNNQSHISKAYVKINAYYMSTGWPYNTGFARSIYCHQFGHALGLLDNEPEIDDIGPDNSCMNEDGVLSLRDPLASLGYKYNIPNSEDAAAINALYAHPEPSLPSNPVIVEQVVDTLPPILTS